MIEHVYLSTACLHARERPELHEHCRGVLNLEQEPKTPAQCKWCPSMCICSCHQVKAAELD